MVPYLVVKFLKLIEENHIGGIGLDVYNEEAMLADALRTNKPQNHPEYRATLSLAEKDNVIFTPHNAFNTEESVKRKAEQSIEQLNSFFRNREFLWEIPA